MRILRPLLAVITGLGVSVLVWLAVPKQLHIQTRIVGFATYASYNYVQWKDLYYILAFVLPATVIVASLAPAVIRRIRKDKASREPLGIFPLQFTSTPWVEEAGTKPVEESASGPKRAMFWSIARLLLPAVVIGMEVSIASPMAQRSTWIGALAALSYVAIVFLISWLRSRGEAAERKRSFDAVLSKVNSIFSVVTIALLFIVSANTSVYVTSTHKLVRYPWLPLWLVVIFTVVALVVVLRGRARRDTDGSWHLFEGAFLTWAIGPVLLFLSVARIAGTAGSTLASSLSAQTMRNFNGFDDSHWLALPRLMFQHGLFPWRDVYTIHGLLQDVFAGQVGLSIFSYSWWGGWAGLGMLVIPIFWISQYCFVAYVSRGNRLIPLAFGIAAVAGLLGGAFTVFSTRFIFLPMTVLLFDQLLRHRTWPRAIGFTAMLVANCIIAPETSIFALILLGVLAVKEITSYEHSRGFKANFLDLGRVGIIGVVVGICWTAYLVLTHSLSAFINYIPYFASNWSEEVAVIPLGWSPKSDYFVDLLFAAPLLIWWATTWRVVRKLRTRARWSSFDWLILATGMFSIAYLSKAVDIPDQWHIVEVLSVSLPGLALWTVLGIRTVDPWLRNQIARRSGRHGAAKRITFQIAAPALCGVLLLIGLVLPARAGSYPFPNSIRAAIVDAPARYHSENSTPSVGLLGYANPKKVPFENLAGLDLLLKRYAQTTLPVVDYANMPGVTYFLLNRVPGSQFYIQEVAQKVAAQKRYIADLQQSRPPLVIFHEYTFGYPDISWVPNSVRSYGVTQYLLTNYTPLVNYRGQLLLLRNDLTATAPPVPDLPGTRTKDLYFTSNECALGNIPNYFTPPAPDPKATKVTATLQLTGFESDIVRGTAIDPDRNTPVSKVLAVSSAGTVLGSAVPSDAPVNHGGGTFTLKIHQKANETVTYYGLTQDGTALFIKPVGLVRGVTARNQNTSVTIDHRTYPLGEIAARGGIETGGFGQRRIYQVHLPDGIDPRAFPWVSISSSNLPNAAFAITSDPTGNPRAQISFSATGIPPKVLTVPAQACLQWHGFTPGHSMYLIESGVVGPSNLKMTLTSGALLRE